MAHKITKNTRKLKKIFLVQKNVPFFLAAKNMSKIGQNWSKKENYQKGSKYVKKIT